MTQGRGGWIEHGTPQLLQPREGCAHGRGSELGDLRGHHDNRYIALLYYTTLCRTVLAETDPFDGASCTISTVVRTSSVANSTSAYSQQRSTGKRGSGHA